MPADRADPGQKKLCPQSQARIGAAGTGGADDSIEGDAQRLGLMGNFLRAVDVAKTAQRDRAPTGMA